MRLNLASCWCAILYFFSRRLKQGLNRNAKMSIPDLMTLWFPSNSPDFFVTCYLVVKRYHWVVVAAVVTVVVVVVVVVVDDVPVGVDVDVNVDDDVVFVNVFVLSMLRLLLILFLLLMLCMLSM